MENTKVTFEYFDDIERVAAQLIAEGNILGWFQGRMEWGPRALGNRSILADPTNSDMQDIVNKYVKYREDFRPFAPSVLEEKSSDYFDYIAKSPFMLLISSVKETQRKKIPAVTHVDGTARPQTVNSAVNPRYWKLIKKFEEIKGVPVVLNTSFNVRGEPMVCTPLEALRCFFGTGMDCLIMGNFLVRKPRQ